jgi:hypothetical protein
MDDNGTPSLDSILVGLKTIQKEMEGREEKARAALDAVLGEKKKIDQMINAAERTGVYNKPGRKPSGARSASALGEEALEGYWQRIKPLKFDRFGDIPGSFSALDIEEKLGVHKSTSQRIVRSLREQGRIRLVGQRYADDNPKHKGHPLTVYVIDA